MAAVPVNTRAIGTTTLSTITAGSSDTIAYVPDAGQILVIRNVSGGAVTPRILGSAATIATAPDTGLQGVIDTSIGFFLPSVPNGSSYIIKLDIIKNYLVGNITLDSASGTTVYIIQ